MHGRAQGQGPAKLPWHFPLPAARPRESGDPSDGGPVGNPSQGTGSLKPGGPPPIPCGLVDQQAWASAGHLVHAEPDAGAPGESCCQAASAPGPAVHQGITGASLAGT